MFSRRVIATALGERAHDVRSADEERHLDGWDDDRLLELATQKTAWMVTFPVSPVGLSDLGFGARVVGLSAVQPNDTRLPSK